METSIENSCLVTLCSAVLGLCSLPGAGTALPRTVQVLDGDATQQALFLPVGLDWMVVKGASPKGCTVLRRGME